MPGQWALTAHGAVTYERGVEKLQRIARGEHGGDAAAKPAGGASRGFGVGARVVRGPTWKWANQDGHGAGVVVKQPDWTYVRCVVGARRGAEPRGPQPRERSP